jgi:vitamin B12 transporter
VGNAQEPSPPSQGAGEARRPNGEADAAEADPPAGDAGIPDAPSEAPRGDPSDDSSVEARGAARQQSDEDGGARPFPPGIDSQAPPQLNPAVLSDGGGLAASPPPQAEPQVSSTGAQAVEVIVRGHSQAERLRRSAEAVHVVETEQAKRNSQDLGEVLARTQGVAVQRSSGLGSDTRISLNGLTDDQIRFFLDGIPLEFVGYPFGIANVPVNLVDRIEIYRGVVPVRFGADALGGAINLMSDHDREAGLHGAASFQGGSFGTYRATVNGHHFDERSGWLTRVGAFLDLAENDYPMEVLVPDATGQEVPARVHRVHDAYRARGVNLETGVVNRPWAKRLSLRGFVTDHDKEVPHNLFMTFNPYGDVEYAQTTYGLVARYENGFSRHVSLSAVAGYAYEHTAYSDLGDCVYSWFGECIRERAQPGERVGVAQDQGFFEHNIYGRVNLKWSPRPGHSLNLSVSPTYTQRSGVEHRLANPDARDPLSAERKLGGVVTGLAYDAKLIEQKLANQLFFKDYFQALRSEDPLSNGDDFRREDRATHRVGFGDSLSYNFVEWLYAKASYEWATRLPRPDEIFGNAFPVAPNLYLKPETSHNVNLGVTVDSLRVPIGELRADVNGFLRDASDLIRLVGDDESASYQNVRDARSLGVEAALGWTSVGEYVALDGNITYVDFRNTSKDGPDAAYEGDRIPNRPYFFGTGSARFQLSNMAVRGDALSLTWTSRYVHEFYRGWESIGTKKPVVPAQLLHAVAVTYFIQGDPLDLSFSGEAQNLTDAEAYDYFGVPKPGRAFYFKMTASH